MRHTFISGSRVWAVEKGTYVAFVGSMICLGWAMVWLLFASVPDLSWLLVGLLFVGVGVMLRRIQKGEKKARESTEKPS
jgi:hypothetical protein